MTLVNDAADPAWTVKRIPVNLPFKHLVRLTRRRLHASIPASQRLAVPLRGAEDRLRDLQRALPVAFIFISTRIDNVEGTEYYLESRLPFSQPTYIANTVEACTTGRFNCFYLRYIG